MKKKIIIILVLISSILIIFKINNHNKEINRYKEIKENVKKEAIAYLSLTQSINKTKEIYLYEDDIVNPIHRGADKNIILDIDNKSYCKVSIKGFVNNNKWDAYVYLKCKKYEDKLYEETLLMYLCMNNVPKGYEEYYNKYGIEYDNFICPKEIEEKVNKLKQS